MQILVVDDVYANRATLKAMLEHFGHTVTTANDGLEGVAEFERSQPDLVIMDIMMPVMDGYAAVRAIKQRCGERFVPVIFVTALSGTEDLVKCIEAGGDDFLVRPFDADLLRAKIAAFARTIGVHANLVAHEQALEQHNKRLSLEMRIGQNVLNKIMRQGEYDEAVLKHWILPLGTFCGDLLLSARTPEGGRNIMLGDITGHGLSAAIGAQPVADIFYGMTAKGYSVGDIAGEINRRVYATLHPEIFCAACLIELDPHRTVATIWNGAMPDTFVINIQTRQLRRVKSMHQALGVVPDDNFDRRPEILAISEHDRIVVCSDGLIEAKNAAKERFGMNRLAEALVRVSDWRHTIEECRSALVEFVGTTSVTDDISLIEIACGTSDVEADADAAQGAHVATCPTRWQAQVTLHADALRGTNPVQVVTSLIMQVQSPHSHRERIFTVVSELVTNAVDHGLLRLDSALKRSADGFAEYYRRRADALAALTDGWVRIELDHRPDGDVGLLHIRVEDSGPGFDVAEHRRRAAQRAGDRDYSGRGLGLVQRLCREVTYNARGNGVDAVYVWAR